MSLSGEKEKKTTAPKSRRKIKYVVIASNNGEIHGCFQPDEKAERIEAYAAKVRADMPHLNIGIYRVSNLNQFLANLRYGKKPKRLPTS